MTSAAAWIKPIMKEPGSLLVYGTQLNQHEYWARLKAHAVRCSGCVSCVPNFGREIRVAKGKKAVVPQAVAPPTASQVQKTVDPAEVDRIVQEHSWAEDGVTKYPRRQVISETLFGPGEYKTDYNSRVAFIQEHVHCGHNMGSGLRARTPELVDQAGDEVPEASAKMSKGRSKGKKRGMPDVDSSEGRPTRKR